MINIAKILKDTPKGMKLYSPLFGEVKFVGIDKQSDYPINVTDCKGNGKSFTEFGVYFADHPDAECLLFPSKDCRTWEVWKVPKPHYDISNFNPFDKVLVRDNDRGKWRPSIFSYHIKGRQIKGRQTCYTFCCIGNSFSQCIPFEGNEHLLGTTDMCDEMYINW